MTPDSLYAALDCENADIDLILGQIADWYADHCDERREAACRWMVAHGKRPEGIIGWRTLQPWNDGHPARMLPLAPFDEQGMAQWFRPGQPMPDYYRHAVDAIADQRPAEVADWWHALRTRGEVPVAGLTEEVTT